ncbi:hypothetical protein Pla110_03170 [Polystyrenella longa]|uniref:Sigma-70, region 4 n=1 Tax=Polystyrenella longa TaxID=2528007 RepID=A0A518CHB7_9PLAN|nr:hypothetical protein [Polystyrenella longa]QDU78613.1 hypothetical protein Pla110_03170 [Polystyrenella longa]
MSVTKSNGTKVVLPRLGVDHLWEDMKNHYAALNQVKWKHFAMLTLAELGNWPIDRIAIVMGHSPGHVSRCIEKVKTELREHFNDPFFENEPEMQQSSDHSNPAGPGVAQRAGRSAFDK